MPAIVESRWPQNATYEDKKLRGVICFVDEILKSAAGKILRRALCGHIAGSDTDVKGSYVAGLVRNLSYSVRLDNDVRAP